MTIIHQWWLIVDENSWKESFKYIIGSDQVGNYFAQLKWKPLDDYFMTGVQGVKEKSTH